MIQGETFSVLTDTMRATHALPIYKVVNDTRLKEMIVSGWRPEHER
jgi:hypothetical protein